MRKVSYKEAQWEPLTHFLHIKCQSELIRKAWFDEELDGWQLVVKCTDCKRKVEKSECERV